MEAERLQKYLARCGVASRRDAEELIASGSVTVNGQTVTEMGIKVNPKTDRVQVAGRAVSPVDEFIYIAFNKPRGVVTTASDPQGRKTVVSLIKGPKSRIFPVGRLDYDTQGLLLLTNDGDVSHALTHPSHLVEKTYLAEVAGKVNSDDLKRLSQGVELEDGPTSPAKVRLVATSGPYCVVELKIHEGRNRQVRRMCQAIGHPVRGLIRTKFGPIALGPLSEGKWRYLAKDEIEQLKAIAQSVRAQQTVLSARGRGQDRWGELRSGEASREGQSEGQVRLQGYKKAQQVLPGKSRPGGGRERAARERGNPVDEGADTGNTHRGHRHERGELQSDRPANGRGSGLRSGSAHGGRRLSGRPGALHDEERVQDDRYR